MTDKPIKISKLRQKILDEKGLERVQEPGKQSRLEPIQLDYDLTPLMKFKELEFGEPIFQLIDPSRGTIYVVGKKLGVHPTTIYYWRKRLGIS